jgi:Outer membrane protein beta-barrel domain
LNMGQHILLPSRLTIAVAESRRFAPHSGWAVGIAALSNHQIARLSNLHKMNTLKNTATIFFLLFFVSANAQIKYGFKTGLNFAHISGPSELNAAGTALESWKNVIGFHIGVSFSHKFTDHFGLRGEALYSKMGGQYKFEGPSYRIFNYTNGSSYATGQSKYLIDVSNAYIDIPVMAFFRTGAFEFSAGGYLGFMVQSTGEGAIQFNDGITENSSVTIEDTEFILDYNYRKDEPGGFVGDEKQIVRVDNRNLELPKTIGAYYDYPEDKGRLYNSLDYGLTAGFSYFLSSSLYAGVRLQYGLADVTNKNADLQKSSTGPNKALLYRDDKDKNFVIQASVGFSF